MCLNTEVNKLKEEAPPKNLRTLLTLVTHKKVKSDILAMPMTFYDRRIITLSTDA